MASQDVIELGSSDEDVEPARKKFAQSKQKKSIRPVPNAMVHIPNNLSGLTIKSTPLVKNSKLTISKSPLKKALPVKVVPGCVVMKKPAPSNLKINPLSIKKNIPTLVNQNYIKNKAAPSTGPKVHQCLSTLPPGITVKKMGNISNNRKPFTSPLLNHTNNKKTTISPLVSIGTTKRPSSSQLPIPKKLCQDPLQGIPIMGTSIVDLEEEEIPCSNIAPKWYKNPENQIITSEEKNNQEPELPKFVEIVIQDSPVKPLPSKRKNEVENELCITVEDSPKATTEKHKDKSETDESGSEDANIRKKVPESKKKLNYPDDNEIAKSSESTTIASSTIRLLQPEETIELEIETIDINENNDENSKNSTVSVHKPKNDASDLVIEIEESPLKKNTESGPSSKTVSEFKRQLIDENETNEYSPTYLKFIELCFQLENTEDMKKIVDKKIKSYYKQVPKEYTESEEFCDLVSSKIFAMKASPDKMYLYIKDIVDELNLQRKLAKSRAEQEEKQREAEATEFYGQEIEQDSKRKRQIRKLEKTLKKLHRAVQKLEEQEVDFDDDGDSVYILTERYKDRLVRVHAKLCQLSNTKMPSEPRLHLEARGRAAGPARRLERWVNRRGPAGALPFPDFHDVLKCVRDANAEDQLGWNEADVMEEARDLFTRCGRKLQRRRQESEWRIAASRLPPEPDPVDGSRDLKQKLENNRQIAARKETELINKFADKQNTLKLEAVEIGDKEAEESPEESGDEGPEDDANDENTCLENTVERKQRLKRLLKEKSKKTTVTETSENTVNDPKTGENNEDASASILDADKPEYTNMGVVEDERDSQNQSVSEEKQSSNKDTPTEEPLNAPLSTEDKNDKTEVDEDIELLSDDSNQIDSDIDELHLLQKLHSEPEGASSSLDSADSPVAISDSPEDNEDVADADDSQNEVVSIENSSYSESELNKDEEDIETCDISNDTDINSVSEEENMQEINETSPKRRHNSNDEYGEAVEDILLASTDDDQSQDKQFDTDSQSDKVNECLNLRDDSISIGETVIEESSHVNEVAKTPIDSEPETENVASIAVNSEQKANNAIEVSTAEVIENASEDTIVRSPEINSESGVTQKEGSFEESKDSNTDSLATECPDTENVATPLNIEMASEDTSTLAQALVTNKNSANDEVSVEEPKEKSVANTPIQTSADNNSSLPQANTDLGVKQNEAALEVDTNSSADKTNGAQVNGTNAAEAMQVD